MATAKKREVTKTRMVEETYTETDGVILELTNDEACYLAALLGSHVSGGSFVRDLSTGVWGSLAKLNFNTHANARTREIGKHITGSVYTGKDL